MKWSFSKSSHQKIGRKLRSSTLKLVTIALLVTALPMIGLFSINYVKSSISQMNTISGQIIQQLDMNTSNIVTSCNQIPSDRVLLALLKSEKNDHNIPLIENRLMELCGNVSGMKDIILNYDNNIYHSVFVTDSQVEEILYFQTSRRVYLLKAVPQQFPEIPQNQTVPKQVRMHLFPMRTDLKVW